AGDAALRARDPPAARADARRSAAAPACPQPRALAARDAGAAVRRRDRDGRGPPAEGTERDPHADAVVGRAKRRLLDGRENGAAGARTRAVRLRARERRAAAARRRLAAALDDAHDPATKAVP